ncbi:hypothetical protein [Chondrinema litorale]|uniref:hypothetical protein n=1 Tax=Chondrinema litorale TaxID=2994555 RepID=UPI0025428F47|nr:hypothetical protein [Chondrinema litorale]UZR98059.1 hypothetical protein OQ292_29995 [Chondrinema litorale]
MESSTTTATSWHTLRKITFRFFFVLFGLFIFPFPVNVFDFVPGISFLIDSYDAFWVWLTNLTGTYLLGLDQTLELTFTGSGDKLFDWVMYLTILIISIISTIIWSIADRKRKSYHMLNGWFMLLLSYYLVFFMMVYGLIKVFYLQFMPPNLEQLYQTLGQISPMRLLWTFMGFSGSYTIFSGVCETVAGVFLMFRRTRTLGGLLVFGVMLNVFMLNMSYDVPVKLFSFQLMIMGLYILMQDYNRIIDFFILNKTAAPSSQTTVVQTKRGRLILVITQLILVGVIVLMQVQGNMNRMKQYGIYREKSPLYGVYDVQTFVINNDTISTNYTDSIGWKRLLIDYPNFLSVVKMNDKVKRYNTELDTLKKQYTFSSRQDTVNKYLVNYKRVDDELFLDGVIEGDTLYVVLQSYDLENFGLLNRGFNWVNEVPYNRYNN